jgi:hypothetical protein
MGHKRRPVAGGGEPDGERQARVCGEVGGRDGLPDVISDESIDEERAGDVSAESDEGFEPGRA